MPDSTPPTSTRIWTSEPACSQSQPVILTLLYVQQIHFLDNQNPVLFWRHLWCHIFNFRTNGCFFFIWQAPYNQITYTAIGDGLAISYFSINSNSGLISVRDTLTKDNSASYTVRNDLQYCIFHKNEDLNSNLSTVVVLLCLVPCKSDRWGRTDSRCHCPDYCQQKSE